MFCTGLKIRRGMIRRLLPSGAIELRSCGISSYSLFVHPILTGPHRYLTKLCDQIVCLMSLEHSQAIMWGDEPEDHYDISTVSVGGGSNRVYSFVVAKTNDKEEDVVARPGFTVFLFPGRLEGFFSALT